MKRLWTIIGVADVARAFTWYQSLLGLPATAPAHDYFGQILDKDGTVLLCLHQWGAHEHPTLASPDREGTGNGLLLFFRVDDFDRCNGRAASSRRLKKSRASIPTQAPWSSHCAIRMVTTSWSARCLSPNDSFKPNPPHGGLFRRHASYRGSNHSSRRVDTSFRNVSCW